MKFGPVPIARAAGAILAHSVALPDGRLRKGKSLSPGDLDRLSEAGLTSVIVAEPGPNDVAEDEAAERLARAIVPDPDMAGLRLGQPGTGRVNIHSDGPGLLGIDETGVHRFNSINPSLTVATLPPHARLDDGTLVATVKIITYALASADVRIAEAGVQDGLMRRHRPVRHSARLIETAVPGQSLNAKGRAATKARLDRFGVALAPREIVDHRTGPLAAALAQGNTDLILILTGSATSDPHDVGPEALRAAGGVVTRVGMPVDPGNLLFIGHLQDVPVIGLPGCARSSAHNGADWVLERVICGLEAGSAEIAAMGLGGLLKEPPSRPRPREG